MKEALIDVFVFLRFLEFGPFFTNLSNVSSMAFSNSSNETPFAKSAAIQNCPANSLS